MPRPTCRNESRPCECVNAILTAWIEQGIREGGNRQVRRMTAAVDHPTLRLICTAIGGDTLEDLAQGSWRETKMQIEVVRVDFSG